MTFVPCNGCTLCCRNALIPVFPDSGDEVSDDEIEPSLALGGVLVLKRKPNGDCIHLGERGCTIYERRPTVCREYDCAAQWRKLTRNERRVRIRKGWLDAAILKRGREIAEGKDTSQ